MLVLDALESDMIWKCPMRRCRRLDFSSQRRKNFSTRLIKGKMAAFKGSEFLVTECVPLWPFGGKML